MLRKPPHVLVTTPESLFILLTAEKSRALFTNVTTIIVDEIHAMARDKRGSHLALTLARLDDLRQAAGGKKPQRIGLSATVRPLEDVAQFLSPSAQVVDVGSRREMTIAVEVPSDELGPVASGEMWAEIYDRVADLIRANRTTLVFVGTRRMSERVAFALDRTARAKASSCRITAASRARSASKPRIGSRTASCARSSRPRRSNSASTSARSIWSCSSARRARSRSRCSASAARVTGSARSPKAASSPPRATN